MITVISLTEPMSEFENHFANASDVIKRVDLSQCTDFWPKGTNAELLIYNKGKIVYSCCYTEAYGRLFITSVWGHDGLVYEHALDYDAIEKDLPVISLENAKVGGFYRFCNNWMVVEKIYKISEEYAREHDLDYRHRVSVTDWNGVKHEFALGK